MRRLIALFLFTVMMGSVTGSIAAADYDGRSEWSSLTPEGLQWIHSDQTLEVPEQSAPEWVDDDTPWWQRTNLDQNRNGIHDALESTVGVTGIGLVYQTDVTENHLTTLEQLGLNVVDVIEAVNGVLLGSVNTSLAPTLAGLDDVVMVEKYGTVVFYGDVQMLAVKARNSSMYPDGAWDLGVSGVGVNIAMVDTGVDNEHPGLSEKFVAGYDAVCYLHSDPTCYLDVQRRDDGTYDPDDGNQHGTACMGMAAATGFDASGAQTEFYGSAPDSALVDVRIGTDAGAGPFENALVEQRIYESAMNGIQWIIDNKDTAWQGADGTNYGIDILSLSWGITSHESGGSDGNYMHDQILNEAMEAGIVVSVAAGNDGPDNDGLSGMGSSDLSLTVGATDDLNTVNREDDTIAGYSSRGPRADNGDGNPLNELKPEISAPGSNIIQAEGCVTSGTCNNLLGGDAADNGYTGRGSGTSYATPSVSGIMALMLEANPDLSPAEVKEIIKLTAERRGEATQPDVDPFWNRDFGWGMVDAYEATKMAFMLKEQNLTGAVDVFTQVHIVNASVNSSNGLYVIEGMAWSQADVVSAVEYRIGDGAWKSASFEQTSEQLAALERFSWTVALDLSNLDFGEHTVEIRGMNSEGVQSLPVTQTITGTGDESSSGGFNLPFSGSLVGLGIWVVIAVGILLIARIDPPLSLQPKDADASVAAALDADHDMAETIDAILVESKTTKKEKSSS
jgi:serine protease AprX